MVRSQTTGSTRAVGRRPTPDLPSTVYAKPPKIRRESEFHPDINHCEHCGSTNTPLWRSGPSGPKSLCNACGLRWTKGTLPIGASKMAPAPRISSPGRKAALKIPQTEADNSLPSKSVGGSRGLRRAAAAANNYVNGNGHLMMNGHDEGYDDPTTVSSEASHRNVNFNSSSRANGHINVNDRNSNGYRKSNVYSTLAPLPNRHNGGYVPESLVALGFETEKHEPVADLVPVAPGGKSPAAPALTDTLDWDNGHFREEARIHEDKNSPTQCCALDDLRLPEDLDLGDVNGLLDHII